MHLSTIDKYLVFIEYVTWLQVDPIVRKTAKHADNLFSV